MLSAGESESSLPTGAVAARVCVEGRGKLNFVAWLETPFVEEARWKFEARNVPKVTVQAGSIGDAGNGIVDHRFAIRAQTCAYLIDAGDRHDPFSAVGRVYAFAAIENIFTNIVRV